MRKRQFIIFFILFIFSGCAYFNTFYNAKTYFSEATRQMEIDLNKSGKISRSTYTIFENAAIKAQKVIEKYPNSDYVDDAMYIFGVSNYYLQKYTIARSMFSRLTLEYPSSPYYSESQLWIARCYYELGEKDIAFKLLEEFISDPKNKFFHSEAMSLAGHLALEDGQEEKAFNYFRQALELTHDIPTKCNLMYELSQIYIDRAMFDDAITMLQKIEEISIDPLLLTRVQLQYAKIYRIYQRYDESEELIKEMLANEENREVFPEMELELAEVYKHQGKIDQAIQRYITITENYPNTIQAAKASYQLGELYLNELQDYENARNAFVNVRQHDRNCPEATYAQEKINQIGQFVSLNKEIASLEEEYPSLKNPTFEPDSTLTDKVVNDYIEKKFSQAEYLAFNFQNLDSALSIYQTLISNFKENPLVPQILNTWSYVAEEAGDSIRAELLKNRLIRDYPFSPFSLYHLGCEHPDSLKRKENQALIFHIEEEYFNQHREKEGMKALKSVLDTATLDSLTTAQILYRLGMEYDETFSNLDSAIYYYQYLSNHYKNTKYAKNAESRLNKLNLLIENMLTSEGHVDADKQDSSSFFFLDTLKDVVISEMDTISNPETDE